MFPPLFPLISASTTVKAIIGSNPVRFYRHGSAPQDVVAPYVTWASVSGTPALQLHEVPGIDQNIVRVDCWSDNDGTGSAGVETLANAVRDAIEPTHHMTQFEDMGPDPDTNRYRISLTFSIWNPRS